MVKQLGNVVLEKGKCAICGGPIDTKWAGNDPALGTECRDCSFGNSKPQVFKPENVEIKVEKTLGFNPLLGEYGYHFNWRGTRVMVNGKIGTVNTTQADLAWVSFPNDKQGIGTAIKNLSYWDLLRIYGEAGGEVDPPPLDLPEQKITPAKLLEKPILPVIVDIRDGMIYSATVGRSFEDRADRIPFIHMLHAFCNLYVRFKFGLMPNFCFEGGFMGKGFEVRNLMNSDIGISVRMHPLEDQAKHIDSFEELQSFAFMLNLLNRSYSNEQSRPEVVKKDANVYEVVSVWINVMETLLRHNWRKQNNRSIADTWLAFGLMKNLLVNIVPEEELNQALGFMPKNKIVQYGRSY